MHRLSVREPVELELRDHAAERERLNLQVRLGSLTACRIQFAPEWLAPYVASLVENPSYLSCRISPFKENASTWRYSFAARTACVGLVVDA